MAGLRFFCLSVLSLSLAFVPTQMGLAQNPANTISTPQFPYPLTHVAPRQVDVTCRFYSLADLTNDPDLCQWIAAAIPEMIRPGTWNQPAAAGNDERRRSVRYFAPSKMLAVCQTPTVHAEIEEFLGNLRKSLPMEKAGSLRTKASPDAAVKPVQFVPDVVVPSQQPLTYPAPTAAPQPKHLFHFIIRYEGEGLIDANVTKFAKALAEAQTWRADEGMTLPAGQYLKQAPQCVPPAVVPSGFPAPAYGPQALPPNMPMVNPPVMPPADALPVPPPPPRSISLRPVAH